MQQRAPKPFLAACTAITPDARNWNAEFQLAWELDDSTHELAQSRQHELYRIESEFEAECLKVVEQIVLLDDNGPRELPKFQQCYRVQNIFLRVLPDSRSGRNFLTALRGVLVSRSRLLTVPLSCMFFYRGMPVLAQALVPMPATPTRLYGGDAGSANAEVEAEMRFIGSALNISQAVHFTCDAFQGSDGRWYVLDTNATVQPLDEGKRTLKRQEMLLFSAEVTETADDAIALVQTPMVLDTITLVTAAELKELEQYGSSVRRAHEKMCQTMHFYGVNVCLMKEVLFQVVNCGRFPEDVVDAMRDLIVVEMIARAIKEDFYLEVQSKRLAFDDAALRTALIYNIGRAVDTETPEVADRMIRVLSKKFNLTDEDSELVELVHDIREAKRVAIVDRATDLVGGRLRAAPEKHVDWRAFINGRVIPRLEDPEMVTSLAAHFNNNTNERHRLSYCLPRQARAAVWRGELSTAMGLYKESADLQAKLYGMLSPGALSAAFAAAKVCLQSEDVMLVAEGRKRAMSLLTVYEGGSQPLTAFRQCVAIGDLLCSPPYFRKTTEDAVVCYRKAISLLPAALGRSPKAVWLKLQPYIGLIRCKNVNPDCDVDTASLVQPALAIVTAGGRPIPQAVQYLWDLGAQLEIERQIEAAAKVLVAAVIHAKKVLGGFRELRALCQFTADVFRQWDADKYEGYWNTVLQEVVDP